MMDADAISEDFVPDADPDVAWIEVDGEAVLYHEGPRTVHVLNPTATMIWRCLDGSGDLRTIASDLAEIFEADPEAVSADVVRAVREMGRQGLLVGVRPDPGTVAAVRIDAVAESEFLDE
jgi:hypothetical protein